MGFYTRLVNCDVWLKEGVDEAAVVQHVKDTMFTDEALLANARGGCSPKSGNVVEDVWYSWVSTTTCREATDLAIILNEFFDDVQVKAPRKGWPHITLELGHDNKQGQEDLLMRTLAPFIAPTASMEWVGEDNERYLWEFDGERMKEKYAVYTWEG